MTWHGCENARMRKYTFPREHYTVNGSVASIAILGVLSYISYIGMYRCEGYGTQVVWDR